MHVNVILCIISYLYNMKSKTKMYIIARKYFILYMFSYFYYFIFSQFQFKVEEHKKNKISCDREFLKTKI